MDETNLREIYEEYVHDLKFHEFKEVCRVCWEKHYGFLVIDVENEKCHYKNQFICYKNFFHIVINTDKIFFLKI